jgi:hypothetical protein
MITYRVIEDMDLDLKELLKNRVFAFILIWMIFTVVIYVFRDYGAELVVIVLAFLLSDVITPLFVRGGKGIFQIPMLDRNKTQPKGYAFIAFFLSIIIVTILVSVLVAIVASELSAHFSDPTICLAAGLILSGLVYIDMNARFYERS